MHILSKKVVIYMCDSEKNKKGEKDMATEGLVKNADKKLNVSQQMIKRISTTSKVKDGKLLFDKENENHRYIVDDE